MYEPAEHNPPAVRSVEVVNDLTTVVEWVCQHGDVEQVALLGWATGGHWTGYYAGLHPERVSHLVLYNTLYGGTADHPSLGRGSSLDDPDRPGQFNRSATGAWRVADAASLLGSWDRSIPVEALDDWRDPAIASAYVEAAISSARHPGHAEVDALKHPTGALEDSFYLAIGRQLWDASFIRARTLVIRSERDFWSRAADAVLLADHLVDAASVEAVTIPGATHFVHLDRPERGRQEFVDAVVAFLATP